MADCIRCRNERISIHAPRVGSDTSYAVNNCSYYDFNPRSPCGERQPCFLCFLPNRAFQSTLPVWGATLLAYIISHYQAAFQSTLPVWGATVGIYFYRSGRCRISIHAPRVGSDRSTYRDNRFLPEEFQSTLPVWGATRKLRGVVMTVGISIHAPRVGSDDRSPGTGAAAGLFQSTLPVWGATASGCRLYRFRDISIHAPRVGSDDGNPSPARKGRKISIHAPRVGSDLFDNTRILMGLVISIHAPRVGSDARQADYTAYAERISIHAPRVGSDRTFIILFASSVPFQSTLPVWGATSNFAHVTFAKKNFNPRSPCGERPNYHLTTYRVIAFQSTLPVWGATDPATHRHPGCRFQSTLPVWGATR